MRVGLSLLGLFGCLAGKPASESAPEAPFCAFEAEDAEASQISYLHSSGDGVVWAANGSASLCFDAGDGWDSLALPDGVAGSIGLWGANDRLYTRDNSSLYRYDGAWGEIPFPEDAEIARVLVRETGALQTLGGYESDCCEDCEVPTYGYQLQRFDGVGWDQQEDLVTHAPLWAMAEVGHATVLVGADGLILQSEGSDWDEVAVGTEAALRDAIAVGDELVAVGSGGALVTGPLDALALTTLDPSLDALAVGVEPGGVLWILAAASGAESASTVLRVEDGAWTAFDVGVDGLVALAVVGEDDVVVSGWSAGGVIARGGTGGFEVVVAGPE